MGLMLLLLRLQRESKPDTGATETEAGELGNSVTAAGLVERSLSLFTGLGSYEIVVESS